MQWVEPDTASTRAIDRAGQQVIQIDQHGAHQYQIGQVPISAKPKPNYQSWQNKMKAYVKHNVIRLPSLN